MLPGMVLPSSRPNTNIRESSAELTDLLEEIVRLGLANSRDQAISLVLEAGLEKAREMVRRRRKARNILREFLETGLPYRVLPRAADVERDRER